MCLENKKGVKAHIIPESFYRYIKVDNPFLEIRSSKKGKHKKRSYTGIYDNTILCADCEKLFQNFDNYAQSLLLPDFKKKDYILDSFGKERGCKLDNINYKYLKLFFVSVLWRASISNREEFSKVDVGPFEKILRKMIQQENPGDEDAFSITITRFNDYLGKKFLLNPHKTRFDGINYYIFYLGAGYKVYIKVDKRPLTGVLSKLILKPSQPLDILIMDDFSKSKEIEVLKMIVKNN